MANKKNVKRTVKKNNTARKSNRAQRALVLGRRVRRAALLALIWIMVLAYAIGYISFVYQKDLRLIAPDVAQQLHEEESISAELADRMLCLLAGRFGVNAQPPQTQLRQDNSTFQNVMQVLNNRADLWLHAMEIAMVISIGSAAVMHAIWRARCRRVISPAREVPVIRARYLDLLIISLAINCVLAAVLHRIGYEGQESLRFAQLAYNGVFVLSPLALILSTRFAAPMCVSGSSCYFH